ncbi:unnamed protein product [Rotaria socialis]|uniref:Uncharacterized protein n=1 Tax=Rotaria socialis TaxID=392032 RepID=A0A818DW28_9BILA|nr:unnamed protein product [Rotaria socialis]
MDNAEISEDIHFRYLILHALIEAGVVGEPIRGSPTWRGLKAALDNHYSMAQDGPSSCMECMKNKPSKLATMKKPSQSLIALKWNVITTNVLYSFTTNVCAISATINDEKQFVIVTRCASGIGLMHQDSVMTVRVSGGSEISLSCDPEAYESDPDQKQRDDVTTEKSVETHPEESVETHPEESFEGGSDHIITPQPNVAGLTIFALIMICMIIAAVYLKVRLSRLERAMAGRIEPPSVSLNTTARAVENRYNEDLSVNCDA